MSEKNVSSRRFSKGFQPLSAAVGVTVVGLFSAGQTLAQSTWTSMTAGTTNWSQTGPTNPWDSANNPVSGATTVVNFYGDTTTALNATAVTASNDIANPFTLNQLNINGKAPTTGAGSLTLSGSPIVFDGTTPSFSINTTGTSNNGTYAVTIGNNLTFNTATTINFNSASTIPITTSGSWSGAGAVTFTGSQSSRPYSLTSAGSYTGNLTVTGSNSVFTVGPTHNLLGSNGNNTGTQTVTITAGAGFNAAFNGGGSFNALQNFILDSTGNAGSSNAALNMTGMAFGGNTYGGLAIKSASTINVSAQNIGENRSLNITRGLVGTGTLTKTGTNYLVLSAAIPTSSVTWGGQSFNGFSGDVNVNAGVLQLDAITNFILGGNAGTGTQKVTVGTGGSVLLASRNSSAATQPQNYILNGFGTGYLVNGGGSFGALESQNNGNGSNAVSSIIVAGNTNVSVTRETAASGLGVGLRANAGMAGSGTLSIGSQYGTPVSPFYTNFAAAANSGYAAFSGKVVVNNGILDIYQTASLGATSADQITLSGLGTVSASLGGGLQQSFLARVSNRATTSGTFAIAGANSSALDFTSLPNARLGSINNSTYSGSLTPANDTFRLGGGGGTLTVSTNLLNGANARSVVVSGPVTLAGTNTFSNGISISGNNAGVGQTAQLNFTGGTGVLPSANTLTFSGTGGTFAYTSANTGASTQSLGQLSFSQGVGAVSNTLASGGTSTSITFASLATRTAGATGNFSISGGSNGTTNIITLSGQGTGFVDRGVYFGGSNYAYNDAGGFLRAPVYGNGVTGDSGFITSGATTSISSATHQEITGTLSAQAGASFDTLRLNISPPNNTDVLVTINSGQTVAVDGVLKVGGSNNGRAVIFTGGSGVATKTAGAELVVRTDGTGDNISLNTPILNNSGSSLTKTGAGQLNIGATGTYTGGTTINQGVLSVTGGNGLPDAGAVTLTGGTLNLAQNDTVGAVTLRNGLIAHSGQVGARTLTATSYAVENGQVNEILAGSGATLTKSTGGLVTLGANNTYTGNTTITAGKLNLLAQVGNTNPISASPVITVGSAANSGAILDVLGVTDGFKLTGSQKLAGSGTILGNVSSTSGTRFAPGNSIGTTTIDGTLGLVAGSILDFEFGSAGNSDKLAVSGALTLPSSGNVTVNLIDNANAGSLGSIGNGTYTLFNYGSLTNAFSAGSLAVGTTPLANKTYTFASAIGTPNAINLTIADAFAARLLTGTPTFNTDRGDVTITGASGSYTSTVANVSGGAVSGYVDIVKGGGSEVTITSPTYVLLDIGTLGTDFTSGQLTTMISNLTGLGQGITAVSSTDPLLASMNNKLTGGANWDLLISYGATTTPSKFEWNFAGILGAGADAKVYNVTAIPEPTMLGFLAAASFGMIARRRRSIR